ncbi:ankyrin repeat protein [Xylariales sp. AK1849]|nr:ankyrin repeat protein [Xylariales sp. AK1849]
MANNPYLLAADNPSGLVTLLRENPNLASGQDDHGYSLVHAAASYNHLDLLRLLIREFHVDASLRDEDQETALFVVETVDAAKVLVEELGVDLTAKNADGQTAREKIIEEAEYPHVAAYLKTAELSRVEDIPNGSGVNGHDAEDSPQLPPPPEGMTVAMSTITPAEHEDAELDPEFRRRIEQLAERDDFHTDAGQAELRRLVQDAIGDRNLVDRNVRPRQA